MLHIIEGGTLHPVIASQTTLESHSNRIGHLEPLHPEHSMKRIKILLSHIRDKKNLKIGTLYFLWFNVSRQFFVRFFIQYFKTIICFIWFNVSRLFLSPTHKKLFVFPFSLFTSTHLYIHVHSPSCHPISNTLKPKTMSFTFNISMIST